MSRYRRYLIALAILAVLLGAYAALGFLAVPYYARRGLVDFVHTHYGRTLTVGAIHFNPFTLTLEATQVSLPDADGQKLLGFGRLRLNLQLASLWRRGPSFGEILLVQPYVRAVIRPGGELNLADLGKGFPPEPRSAKPQPKSAPLRLYIGRLAVISGACVFEERNRPTPFHADLRPITFELRDFSTVAAKSGNAYTLDAESPEGERLLWSGNVHLAPLASHGTFEIANLKARTVWNLLSDSVAFELDSGVIGIKGGYDLSSDGGPLGLKLNVASTTITQLGIKPKGGAEDYVTLARLEVDGTQIDLTRHSVGVAKVQLAGGELKAWMSADGRLNLLDLIAPAPEQGAVSPAPSPTPAPPPAPPPAPGAASGAASAPAWGVSVPDIAIQGLKVSAEDRHVQPAAAIVLDPVNLRVQGFNTSPDDTLDITLDAAVKPSGELTAKAKLAARTGSLSAHVEIKSLALTLAQPYIAQTTSMSLLRGTLGTKADIEQGADGVLALKAAATIADLHTVDNALRQDFINWKELRVADARYRSKTKELRIGSVTLVEPYARMIIAPDKTLNIAQVLKPPGAAAAEAAPAAAPPSAAPAPKARADKARAKTEPAMAQAAPAPVTAFPISIGTVRFVNASLNYSDLWIKPSFSVGIQTLNGTVNGLSSDPESRAKISLDGKIDRYAPVHIGGEVNLLSAALYTDVTMSFKDVDLTIVNPYSGHFVGYSIDKGKLAVDVSYKIERRKLTAEQHFVVDQLELGDKVESPDAVHAPVKLAVALMKDRHGVIDIDLPMSGSIDDPQFRIGPLIWKAFVNLIVKAVTAPFALLGNLFGGGEHMNVVEFLPASAELDKPAQDQMTALSKSLQERPQLKLDVPIVYSANLDRPELAGVQLRTQLLARVANTRAGRKQPDAALDTALADPEQHFELLLAQYRADIGKDAPLPPSVLAVQATKRGETPAYDPAIADLNAALIEHIQVADADLEALGKQRAQAIQDALLSSGQIDPGRVFIVNTPPKPQEGAKVKVELALR